MAATTFGPSRDPIAIITFALVEAALFDEPERFALKSLDLATGTEDVVFERFGDPLWENAIGEQLALSTAGQVAFISHGRGHQLPRGHFIEGPLEVWDLSSKQGRTTHVIAVEQPLSWSPNGRLFAFVTITNTPDPALSVALLDTATWTSRVLHRGTAPVFSEDGLSVLITENATGLDCAHSPAPKSSSPVHRRPHAGHAPALAHVRQLPSGKPHAGAQAW
jgi:hypothetical protein